MSLKDRVEQLEKENNLLRGLVAFSELPCVYCQLPAKEISRCELGFPGCGRADDMLNAPPTIQVQFPDSIGNDRL